MMNDAMSAKTQAGKETLLVGLVETRGKILEAAASLAPVQQDEVFLGVWSVKDLLAPLIGWDVTNLEAVKAILAGQLPAFYAYHDKDWRSYNAELVARYKQENFPALLAAAAASHHQLITSLQTIPAEEFDKDRGIRFRGYKVTLTRLLQAEMKDETVHYSQIEAIMEQSSQGV